MTPALPEHTTEVSLDLHAQRRSPLLKREMPGLDALRGVAVLAVVAYHGLHWWLPPGNSLSRGVRLLSQLATPGWLGVNLFFILSGFLITGILIDSRERPHYWKNFYVRRMLRILPLYVAVLVYLRIGGGLDWRYLLLCLLYLANFASARHGVGYGPLWSLAVEEQFYLLWPTIVRRLRLRSIAIACIASIVLSPPLRYLTARGVLYAWDAHPATWLVTDNLAAGALIAVLLRMHAVTRRRALQWALLAALAGTALLALGLASSIMHRDSPLGTAFQPEPFLLFFTALLLVALAFGDHPLFLRCAAPLRFYGYISYGLYLIHAIGFFEYQRFFIDGRTVPAELTLGPVLVRFFSVLAATTLFCLVSRRYFEEFFLRLKDRLVPYDTRSAKPQQAVAAG